MKRLSIAVFFGLVLLLLVGNALAGAVATQEESFDLTITEIKWQPETIHANEAVEFSVEYANVGKTSAPADAIIEIDLSVMLQEPLPEEQPEISIGETPTETTAAEAAEEPVDLCSGVEEAPGAVGLKPDDRNVHAFSKCFIIEPGGYEISATIKVITPTTLQESSTQNNSLVTSLAVGSQQTALPDELARLFAGLGMFAAVMAIMAVGTEVVIDSLKVFIGMKSKVTSLETLDKMEKLLPGQLADLGVGATAQKQFKELTRDMRKTLTELSDVTSAITKAKSGEFGELIKLFEEFKDLDPGDQKLNKKLDDLKKLIDETRDSLEKKIDELVKRWFSDLNIPGSSPLIDEVKKWVAQQFEYLDNLLEKLRDAVNDPKKFEELLKEIKTYQETALEEFQNWSQKLTAEWLEAQRDLLLDKGETEIKSILDDVVVAELNKLGLPDELVNEAKIKVEQTLSVLNLKALKTTDTYIKSLENLLNSVEQRRFDMQSPIRKLWRRLRQAGAFWGFLTLLLILSPPMGIIVQVRQTIREVPNWSFWTHSLLWGVGLSIALILILAILGWLFYYLKYKPNKIELPEDVKSKRWFDRQIYKINIIFSPNFWSWLFANPTSPTILSYIEVFWNWLHSGELHPETYDKPKLVKDHLAEIVAAEGKDKNRDKEEKLTPERVGQLLLLRSDKQRDEESSRLRWLRVFSAVIGLGLAYLLQMDAAELLDAVVPGISDLVNAVFNFKGEYLHALWRILPPDLNLTAGMALTGMAASAGSTFWHDQLDRLQSAKKGAETAAQLLQQAKQLTGQANK